MKAMVLKEHCEIRTDGGTRKRPDLSWKEDPLLLVEMERPQPAAGQVLVKVSACGICHTELDEIEGRLTPPRFPIIPGHEVVGRIESMGPSPT